MRSLVCFAVAVATVACAEAPPATPRVTIATLSIVAQPAGSLAVLTNVGKLSVRAMDSSGAGVPGAFVSFVLSRGSGRVTASADTTDATGLAETTLILGSTPGPHTILAAIRDIPPVESGIVTGIPGAACLNAATASEYLIVAHYNTTVNSVNATVNLLATGVIAPTAPYPNLSAAPAIVGTTEEASFESRLRERERAELPSRVAGARAWMRARQPAVRVALKEGDLIPFNTNPSVSAPTRMPCPLASRRSRRAR